jgi:hypothetical protein
MNFNVPEQLHGEINGSNFDYFVERHILQHIELMLSSEMSDLSSSNLIGDYSLI